MINSLFLPLIRRWVLFSTYLVLLNLVTGCPTSSTSVPIPSPNPSSLAAPGSGNGLTFGNSDFFVNVVPTPGSTMFLHKDGSDWTQACNIPAGQNGQDTYCILEAQEFDLHILDTVLQYNVPAAQCAYAAFTPYFYYIAPGGIGDTAVDIHIDSSGNPTLTSHSGAINATISLSPAGDATPVCDRDYSTQPIPGPNCCEGSYKLTVITDPSPGPSPSPTQTTVTSASWGGAVSNCLSGPAVDTQVKDKYGFPTTTVTFLANSNLNRQYTIKSPASKLLSSNVYVSNYFNSPTGPYTYTNAPAAIKNNLFRSGYPWYETVCYDHSREIVNRIRVLIRSWSTSSDFATQIVTNSTTTGVAYGGDDQLFDFTNWIAGSPSGPSFPQSLPYPSGYPALSN